MKLSKSFIDDVEKLLDFPHPRFVEAFGDYVKKWGSADGFRAAESFSLVKQLKSKLQIVS